MKRFEIVAKIKNGWSVHIDQPFFIFFVKFLIIKHLRTSPL